MSQHSILEIYDMETGVRRTAGEFDRIIEAPNWLLDGDTILYNSGGRIWRYSLSGGREEPVDTGECVRCNNDHVPSPDNRFLAVSCHSAAAHSSQIYILPIEGGAPRLVTEKFPSYLHGWPEKESSPSPPPAERRSGSPTARAITTDRNTPLTGRTSGSTPPARA